MAVIHNYIALERNDEYKISLVEIHVHACMRKINIQSVTQATNLK